MKAKKRITINNLKKMKGMKLKKKKKIEVKRQKWKKPSTNIKYYGESIVTHIETVDDNVS